ncbi:MAG: DNA (cytosine-5-)-methyltransferase [Microgenomates group bacterium]
MNVVSFFDGISAGKVALERAKIKIDSYYAFEVDKHAMIISGKNHPSIMQMGDVNNWRQYDFPKVDLFLAGFPCQSWSNAGLGLGLEDLRGQLIYPMLAFIKHHHPKYLLLENVKGLMSKKNKPVLDFILSELKSYGYETHTKVLNSDRVSAQSRERLYITNWDYPEPEDKGILLCDIIENGAVDREKSYCIDANYYKGGNPKSYFDKARRQLVFDFFHQSQKRAMVRIGTADDINGHDILKRIYHPNGKSPTLAAHSGGNSEPKVALDEKYWRKLTVTECEALQTFDVGYTEGISSTQRYKTLGNSWTCDMVAHMFRYIPKPV